MTRNEEIVPHQIRGKSLIRADAAGISGRNEHVIRFSLGEIAVNRLGISEVKFFREKIAIALIFQLSNDSGPDERSRASYKDLRVFLHEIL